MADPILISVTVVDYRAIPGNQKAFNAYLPDDTAFADAVTATQALITAVDPGIDGYISKASVLMPVALPGGIGVSAEAGNTVREGALLSIGNNQNSRTQEIYIPTWKNTGFSGDSVIVSLGTPGLAVTEMLANLGTPDYGFVSSNNYKLSAIKRAVRKFRK